jgi:hypothetical protein
VKRLVSGYGKRGDGGETGLEKWGGKDGGWCLDVGGRIRIYMSGVGRDFCTGGGSGIGILVRGGWYIVDEGIKSE